MELSPNYAGTLMGLTGAIANTAGFISPYIVGIIVEDQVRIPKFLVKLDYCWSNNSPFLNKSIYLNHIILLANYGSLEYCILDCKYYMCCLQRNILSIWNIRAPMVGHILGFGKKRFTT